MTPEQFAQKLKARREQGETMASLGKSLGVSRMAIMRWQEGIRRPTATVLILAELLWARQGDWPIED